MLLLILFVRHRSWVLGTKYASPLIEWVSARGIPTANTSESSNFDLAGCWPQNYGWLPYIGYGEISSLRVILSGEKNARIFLKVETRRANGNAVWISQKNELCLENIRLLLCSPRDPTFGRPTGFDFGLFALRSRWQTRGKTSRYRTSINS